MWSEGTTINWVSLRSAARSQVETQPFPRSHSFQPRFVWGGDSGLELAWGDSLDLCLHSSVTIHISSMVQLLLACPYSVHGTNIRKALSRPNSLHHHL